MRAPKAPVKEIDANVEKVLVMLGRCEIIGIAAVNNFDFGPKVKADTVLTSKYYLLTLPPEFRSPELCPAFP